MEKDNQFQQIWEDGRRMAYDRFDLFRLELLEKSAKMLNLLLVTIVALLVAFVVIVFLAIAATHFIGEWMGSMAWAYLIMAGLFALCFGYVIINRHNLFLNRMIRNVSAIIFAETSNVQTNEENEEPSK